MTGVYSVRSWWQRPAVRLGVTVAGVGIVVLSLRGRLHDLGRAVHVLATADRGWLIAGLAAQIASQLAFALQQRRLLNAVDVAVSIREATTLTLSRSALSMALPAGSAVSAAYALREFRRYGADTATAATVTVLSGLASLADLLAMCAAALIPATTEVWGQHRHVVVAGVMVLVVVVTGARAIRRRRPGTHFRTSGREPSTRAGHLWRTAVAATRSISPKDGGSAVLYAALNWSLDAACLIAAARACALPVSWHAIAVAYLTVQVVRQIPLTPGGIGLIEASLTAALSRHGSPAAAIATVLGYRLLSFWMILVLGSLTYVVFGRRTRRRSRAAIS